MDFNKRVESINFCVGTINKIVMLFKHRHTKSQEEKFVALVS